MLLLTVFWFASILTDYSNGYSLEPAISWPEEYHFNAEQIDLIDGVVKPFEIWYSTKYNRSRVDFYGGTTSRYYYGIYLDEHDVQHDGKIYMIHPQVSEDDEKLEIKCNVEENSDEHEDFLPPTDVYSLKGVEKTHDGKEVQEWESKQTWPGLSEFQQTLLVTEIGDGVFIPLRHTIKEFNLVDGFLESDDVINYYNYDDKIPKTLLDASHKCSNLEKLPENLEDSLEVLHPFIRSDIDLAFQRFKRHHLRNYEDEEHHFRKKIFERNWNKVVEHNSKNLSYQLGINQFSDKTRKELSYLSGVTHSVHNGEGIHVFTYTTEEIESIANELPESFDMRTEGFVSPVKNQGACGSCWAFAIASTMEGAVSRANGGRVIDLSEQSLVDCAWAFDSHGCGGTEYIDSAYKYVLQHGIPTVAEYGLYLEEDGYCKVGNMTEIYTIKGFAGVTQNSVNSMKAALYKYGPVTIGVSVSGKMSMYKSGIFYDVECDTTPDSINHAVTVVGYGVRDGDLYWIVKNSWGESWGEDGYILISARDNNCNVLTEAYYPIL